MRIDIGRIKNKLLVQYPFFGSVVANLTYIETKNCLDNHGHPTAGTDGKTVFYHPDFISNLSESEQVFVFAHEICHVAFNHIFRSEGKDKEIWNIATDAVINAFLKKDGLTMVDGGIDIPDALNYDAEELYQKLLEQKQQNENKNESEQKNSNSGDSSSVGEKDSDNTPKPNNQVGHDSHSLWDEAIQNKNQENQANEVISKSKENSQEKHQKSFLDKLFKKNKEKEEPKEKEQASYQKSEEKQLEEQVEKITKEGEKKSFNQNKIERRKRLEELRETLAKQSTRFGLSTNSTARTFGDIGTASPLIDWTVLLTKAVKVDEDWSFQNASIEYGVITPHLEELESSETEILLDTSGSVSEILLKNFLRECKNILANSKVKVGCFDTKFYGFHEIRDKNDIDNMSFIGGGGTNFNVAVNAFSKNADNKIIFTDGEAPMPEQYLNVIWIVFGNKKINPPGGKVIYIDEQQLMKLQYVMIDEMSSMRKVR